MSLLVGTTVAWNRKQIIDRACLMARRMTPRDNNNPSISRNVFGNKPGQLPRDARSFLVNVWNCILRKRIGVVTTRYLPLSRLHQKLFNRSQL